MMEANLLIGLQASGKSSLADYGLPPKDDYEQMCGGATSVTVVRVSLDGVSWVV